MISIWLTQVSGSMTLMSVFIRLPRDKVSLNSSVTRALQAFPLPCTHTHTHKFKLRQTNPGHDWGSKNSQVLCPDTHTWKAGGRWGPEGVRWPGREFSFLSLCTSRANTKEQEYQEVKSSLAPSAQPPSRWSSVVVFGNGMEGTWLFNSSVSSCEVSGCTSLLLSHGAVTGGHFVALQKLTIGKPFCSVYNEKNQWTEPTRYVFPVTLNMPWKVICHSPHGDIKYVTAHRAWHSHVSQAFPSDDHAGDEVGNGRACGQDCQAHDLLRDPYCFTNLVKAGVRSHDSSRWNPETFSQPQPQPPCAN